MKTQLSRIALSLSLTLFAMVPALVMAQAKPAAQEKSLLSEESSRWERTVIFPAVIATELVAVPLDSDAFTNLTESGSDLRILTSQGAEVAWLRQVASEPRTHKTWRTWNVSDPALTQDETTGLIVYFQLNKHDPAPQRLGLHTPLTNFEQGLKLIAIEGGQETELVSAGLLFDYSKFMNVRRTEIEIPPTTAREFKLVISSPTTEQESQFLELTRELRGGQLGTQQERLTIDRRPFRIDRIELKSEVEEAGTSVPVTREYPIEILSQQTDAQRQETNIELGSLREPLTRLTVATASRNFSRSVRVEVVDKEASTHRRVLATGTLKRIDLRTLKEELLSIEFSPHNALRYFLVIENGDSAELTISDITAEGHVEHVAFLAEPGENYRMAYGQRDLDAPRYDTAALQASLSNSPLPVSATLGPAEKTAFHRQARPLEIKDLWNNPWITGAIVLVLVAVLGWALFNAAAKIDTTPAGDKSV